MKKSNPHRPFTAAITAFGLLTIVILESTPAGGWIFETGAIHLTAIAFAAIAFMQLFRRRLASAGEFGMFSKIAAAAMATLGVAHVIEYFGDTRHLFGEAVIITAVGGLYFASFILLAFGANALLKRAGAAPKRAILLAVIAFGLFLAALVPLYMHDGEESRYVGAALVIGWLFCMSMLRLVAHRITVLAAFVGNLRAAATFVLLSFGPEVFAEPLEGIGLAEARIENVAHYFFYAGLVIYAQSFDSLRHLGGIYADLREEAGEKEHGS